MKFNVIQKKAKFWKKILKKIKINPNQKKIRKEKIKKVKKLESKKEIIINKKINPFFRPHPMKDINMP